MIATLNNQAAYLLQRGSTDEALRTLRCAVNRFISAQEIETDGLSLSPLHQTHSEDNNDTTTLRSVEVAINCQRNQNWCQFLFHRALLIPLEEASLTLKSAIVLYNLALINHVLAIAECASNKLASARKLYLLALDLVKKHSQEHGSNRALLVSLAIANNLGDLYLQQSHDAEEAKKCFSLLEEILKHVDQLELNASSTPFVSQDYIDEEYGFFILNALVRGKGTVTAATAA